ncbi:MAG: lipopolysaccharide assembly protein LapA domain-containing protein [Carnobacterium maltaromaticum]
MKNQWRLVVGIILVLIIVLFAIFNVDVVPVNFGFIKVDWPLIMIILGSLFIGAIATVLVSTSSSIQVKKELKKVKKELDDKDNQTKEQLSKVQAEYEQELLEKEVEIEAKQKKINSLEDELVSKMTNPIV